MKKTILPAVLFSLLLWAIPDSIQAQRSTIGVGAMIGTPNGFSIKSWIGNDIAIDGALSFTLGENSTSFYLHSDVLLHKDLEEEGVEVERGDLRLYYGAGLKLQWFDVIDEIYTGIRAPAGFTYQLEQSPAELFFELVPTLDFNPSFRFSFGGAIGARYYLGE